MAMFARHAFSFSAALGLLTACGVSQPPLGAPRAAPAKSSSGYQVLYTFKPSPDGSEPAMTLLALNGMLYGTTQTGGAHSFGTVFVVSPTGNERVLYSFKGSPDDGSTPEAGLVAVDGKLYGTTKYGGTGGEGTYSGTVFEVTISGNERVLHNFTGAPDGAEPLAALTPADHVLYGTTLGGGSSTCAPSSSDFTGCGTVFAVTLAGKETIVHRFQGTPGDGSAPAAPLLAVGKKFYGTTSFGGTDNAGTVYEIGAGGKERVVHSFAGVPDGKSPLDGLIIREGHLYGTTGGGGAGCLGYGCGTLFEISRTGEERVIHDYEFDKDSGWSPSSGVLAIHGSFYGTAFSPSDGTIYEIGEMGKHARLLHRFTGAADGSDPNGLTLLNGELYGTTSRAGNCDYHDNSGCGTVFKIAPR